VARRASIRNNFSSGVLDPLLAARSDLEQYRAGLKTGTNVMLLPHGGFMRRPGLRFGRQLTGLGSPEYPGRLSRFRVNREDAYILHWRDDRLDIYEESTEPGGFSDTNRITRVRTPYGNEHIPDLYLSPKSQTADTAVICHPTIAPHRLLRGALRTTNPVRTYNTETRVRIYHPDHKLLTNDEVGFSGLTATGGVTATSLNSFYAVTLVGATFAGSNVSLTAGDATMTITLPTGHGFEIGDRITLAGLPQIGGVSPTQLNRTHTIATTAATTVTVELPLSAVSSGTGGTGATWKAANFYEITVGSAATSSADGGGTAGRAWVLHSLKPNTARAVALENLPQFDFEDGSSPAPQNERQRIIFDDFANGDSYKLELAVPFGRGGGTNSAQTPFLDWTDADIEENARIMQDAFLNILGGTLLDVTVTYDTVESGGGSGSPGPDHHEFIVEFTPSISISLIDVFKIRGSGTIDITRDVAGGSTEEDVISDTRGWPGGCIFHDRRLWFFRLTSRPSTILASKVEDFFDFETGDAADNEAIDATGEFDPVLHMVSDRGLWLLTTGSEVEVASGDGEGITPTNINLRPSNRYGSTEVVPVSVAGRPIYVDRTGRTMRQLGFTEASGAGESQDISILSQFLISDPVAMDVWRNVHGDYAAVVMADGTMAVLNINVDQGVAGWTKWTTDGSFLDVCEAGDQLYAITSRTVAAATVYFLEAFDFDYHTDAGVFQAEPLGETVWTGHDHLEGRTVQVRLNGMTMATDVVSGGDVSGVNGDVTLEGVFCEAGLAIPTPTAEPMPPQTDLFTSIVRAEVDRYQSREMLVNGFRIPDLEPGETAAGPVALDSGAVPITIVGWGERQTITITMPNPQPGVVRAVTMEVA
jgi:hypothetical protein